MDAARLAQASGYALAAVAGILAGHVMRRRAGGGRARVSAVIWWHAAAALTAATGTQALLLATGAASAVLMSTLAFAAAAAFAVLLAALVDHSWTLATGRTLPLLPLIGAAVAYHAAAVWALGTVAPESLAANTASIALLDDGGVGTVVFLTLALLPVVCVAPLLLVARHARGAPRARAGLVAGGVCAASLLPLALAQLPLRLPYEAAEGLGLAAGATAIIVAYAREAFTGAAREARRA